MPAYSKALQKFLETPIEGSAFGDASLMSRIWDFVFDETDDFHEQQAALIFLYEEVMGLEPIPITPEFIKEFVDDERQWRKEYKEYRIREYGTADLSQLPTQDTQKKVH